MNTLVFYAVPSLLLVWVFVLIRQVRRLIVRRDDCSVHDLLAVPLTVVYLMMIASGARMYWTFAGQDAHVKPCLAQQQRSANRLPLYSSPRIAARK